MTQGGFSVDPAVLNEAAGRVSDLGDDVSDAAENLERAMGPIMESKYRMLGSVGFSTVIDVAVALATASNATRAAGQSLQTQSSTLNQTAGDYNQTEQDTTQSFSQMQSSMPSSLEQQPEPIVHTGQT